MTPLTRAAIVAVGSEMLTPSRVDTNSLAITERLNRLGIDVVAKAVVGDDRADLGHVVTALLARADLLVTSGGLGPTDDDLTREVVAEVLGRRLDEDAAVLAQLEERFASRGLGTMPRINRRQAMVPAGAVILPNAVGSAPGLWIEQGAQVVVLLPGPPRELQPMLDAVIEARLAPRASGVPIARRVVLVAGRVESQVEESMQPLYGRWAGQAVPILATILAKPGSIELHLSARASNLDTAHAALEVAVGQTAGVLGADVYSVEGRSLEEVVGEMLAGRSWRIGVAESCTGGLLTSRLTDVPGSSQYLDLGVVAYANTAKTAGLDVPADLIGEHGAVSEPVAVAMAHGVRARAGAEVGVGVTGIAGPGGGTAEKPVGTVAIAVAAPHALRSRTFRFRGDRRQVKFQASQAALDMTRRLLMGA